MGTSKPPGGEDAGGAQPFLDSSESLCVGDGVCVRVGVIPDGPQHRDIIPMGCGGLTMAHWAQPCSCSGGGLGEGALPLPSPPPP